MSAQSDDAKLQIYALIINDINVNCALAILIVSWGCGSAFEALIVSSIQIVLCVEMISLAYGFQTSKYKISFYHCEEKSSL